MRHHIHSQKLGGKIAKALTDSDVDKFSGNKMHSSMDLVNNNSCTLLPPSKTIDITNNSQLDMFAYTYPYHANVNYNMFPQDCGLGPSDSNLSNIVNTFKLRYPLLQLRFNVHDSEHRPSCFKKGCECRNNLPQYQQPLADIVFDEKNNNVVWDFVDGTKRKITPFKYMPKRGIADQFMNMYNDIVSTLLACNNNVTSGDKIRFYYITMYQSKNNQTEEAASYYSICASLSRRLKYQQQVNENNQLTETAEAVVEEDIAPDYCEGLKRTLSAIYAHTSANVLSATMSHLLLDQTQRFTFSHDFVDIPTHHILQWCDGEIESLTFRLRKVKVNENEYDVVGDYAINNLIYRPIELENMCQYEQLMLYELKKIQRKKRKDGECNEVDTIDTATIGANSENIFTFTDEHPSHKYMSLNKRKKIAVPRIGVSKMIPNVKDLHLNEMGNQSEDVMEKRETYAKIALVLFYPFRIRSDLVLGSSYWRKYLQVLNENKLWKKGLEILQNIQDVNHNCKDFVDYDPLLNQTKLNSCPEDKELEVKLAKPKNTRDVTDYESIFEDIVNNNSLSQEVSTINHRSLSNIIDRVNSTSPSMQFNVKEKTIEDLKSVTNIPDTLSFQQKRRTITVGPESGCDGISNIEKNKSEIVIEMMLTSLHTEMEKENIDSIVRDQESFYFSGVVA